METRSSKRQKLLNPNHNNTGKDRITDLPDAILHHILSLLPIKTAVQTSILSKRWKTLWYTLPDLDFTSIVPSRIGLKKNLSSNNLCIGNEITNVLSLRDKLSDVRTLRFNACMSFSGLQALVRSAIKLGVQELDIRVETSGIFNFPRSIITHDGLRVLIVEAFQGFRLPPTRVMRSGFQTLQKLSLSNVYLGDRSSLRDMFTACSFPQLKSLQLKDFCGLIHLRVGCPVLEELVLKKCLLLQGLEILCPRLVILKVSRCFDAYCAEDTCVEIDTPRLHTLIWVNNSIASKNSMQNLVGLHEATIGFVLGQQALDAQHIQSISSFLCGLSHVVSLTLEPEFVEIISKNNPLGAIFFNPFEKLNLLELQTNEVMCLANVLKTCPIIHTLVIKVACNYKREIRRNRLSWDLSRCWTEQYWDSRTKDLRPLLHHLKAVKIQGLSDYDINLVKFLLQHGEVLQELIISLEENNGCHRHEKLKSQIMGFPRSSPNAKLAFLK